MKILDKRAQLADLAEVIGTTRAPGAEGIVNDASASSSLIMSDADSRVLGWRREHNVDVLAWVIRWTWESWSRGPRPQEVTLIQVVEAGRSDGEGWAYARQYLASTALTAEEAELVAKLISTGALPALIAEKEL